MRSCFNVIHALKIKCPNIIFNVFSMNTDKKVHKFAICLFLLLFSVVMFGDSVTFTVFWGSKEQGRKLRRREKKDLFE